MHAGKEVKAEGHHNAQQHNPHRKNVQHQPVPTDGIHEAWAYLHADGIDEQDKAELLDKMEHISFDAKPQVPKQDTHKERSCTAKANPLDLDFSDHEADCRREGNRHNLLPYRGLGE